MYNHITPNNQWIWWLDESPFWLSPPFMSLEPCPGMGKNMKKHLERWPRSVKIWSSLLWTVTTSRSLRAETWENSHSWLVGWSVGHENGIDGYIFDGLGVTRSGKMIWVFQVHKQKQPMCRIKLGISMNKWCLRVLHQPLNRIYRHDGIHLPWPAVELFTARTPWHAVSPLGTVRPVQGKRIHFMAHPRRRCEVAVVNEFILLGVGMFRRNLFINYKYL
jgi:hypothetical protein